MSSSQGTVNKSPEDKGTGDNSRGDPPPQHPAPPPPSSLTHSPDSKMETAPELSLSSLAGNRSSVRQSSSRHHSDRYFSRDRVHSSSSASSSTSSRPQHPPPPPHHHHPYYRHDPHTMQSPSYPYPPPPHHYSREHHPYPYDPYSRGAPPHGYRHPPPHGYVHPNSVRSPPYPEDGASSFHQPPPPPPSLPLSSSSSSRQQTQPIPPSHLQQQQPYARRYSRNGAGSSDHYTSQSSSSPSPHGANFPSSLPYPYTHGHPPYGPTSSLPSGPPASSRNTKMVPSPPHSGYPLHQGPSPPLGPSSSSRRKVKTESVSGMPAPSSIMAPAAYVPPRPCPPPVSENDPASRARIVIVQQPLHARMCGFGEKDRRPIDPPPIVQLFMDDNPHYNELKLPVKLKMPAPSKKGRAAAARKAAAAVAAAAAEAAAAEEAAAQARAARREERRAAKLLEKQQKVSSSSSTPKKSSSHHHHHQGREMTEESAHKSGGLVGARSGNDMDRRREGRWGGESGNEEEDGTYELDEDDDMGEGSDDRQRDRRRSSYSSAGLHKHRTSTGSIKEEMNGGTGAPSSHRPHHPSQAGKKQSRTSDEGDGMDSGRDGSDDASRHSHEDDDNRDSESESESTSSDSESDDNSHSSSKDAAKRRERKPIIPVLPPTVPGQPPIPIQYPRYPGGRAALAIDPLFVLHASLWSEDGKEVRSMIATPGQTDPPKLTRILMGAVVVSPILLNNEKGVPGWYFSFPDLSIRTEGVYRLKFSLMRFASFDFDDRGGSHASHIVSEVTSEPFTVFSAKKFPGMTESTELSKAFAKQGLKIPIRNDLRPRKNNDKDD